ncbi:hypothetical protein FE773_05985 [Caminibacter mediatlanticus TB-2]|uniref:Outer-membrane lipoprotein carrier protein n=1 Tax=Caminibacter mediatlanticus TB-2 TaxID=391592 RepID=A0AAI9AI06_9BACT|nr:LolA-like outer membrane lipoprotein chaperone [Caminibacter mediatlanticus]EDM23844.1 outer-membrane lipoprotein carrier protein precursor [Caminibacter mediatlanticus TB-2]QCT94744.1 hypothetical protein FE773_05985 [Caminibacter mediatlanticus TB-2]
MRLLVIMIMTLYSFALTLPNKFSSEFIQTINSNDKNLTYKGKVYLNNNEIVWKYIYPNNKIIWVKDKVYIYEPDLEQLTITKRNKLSLRDIVKNAKKIKNNLYFSKVENKKIYFIYDKTLKKLYYKNNIGNKITIKFFNQKNDVNKSVFKINLPKDIDIIYQN